MNSKLLRLIAIVTVLAFAAGAQAQRRNSRYVDYINKYSALAVQQMKEHKIPASITLAQGLLESGAGMSTLARKSNNHFGIKCGSNWNGRTVRHETMPVTSVFVRTAIPATRTRTILHS